MCLCKRKLDSVSDGPNYTYSSSQLPNSPHLFPPSVGSKGRWRSPPLQQECRLSPVRAQARLVPHGAFRTQNDVGRVPCSRSSLSYEEMDIRLIKCVLVKQALGLQYIGLAKRCILVFSVTRL